MKFDAGEARLLMPDGDRVVLYQVPMGSGIRYTNGNLDLRGKGMDLQLIRNGSPDAARRLPAVSPAQVEFVALR